MNDEAAKKYYCNWKWLEQFYADLVTLLRDNVGEALRQTLKYKDSWPVFPSRKREPTLPYFYGRQYYGTGRPSLSITALLRKEWDNGGIQLTEPALMILVMSGESDTGITTAVLDDDCFEDAAGPHSHFSGKVDWKDLPLVFHGFFVPLDTFSEEQLKDTKLGMAIQERIVEPLRKIIDENFSESGKKPKSGA